MAALSSMIGDSNLYENPIFKIKDFLETEQKKRSTLDVKHYRKVGYVMSIDFDSVQIITNDVYKLAVGGIPRGTYLILVPSDFENLRPHFVLLRVQGVCPTPLEKQVQDTYFDMHKHEMPELDIWTESDLMWGSLKCDLLGMFYADPEHSDRLTFSGDINNILSAHRYEIYAPDEELLDLIVNGMVCEEFRETIGHLRTMECMFEADQRKIENIPVQISMRDFMGTRTAMFGKTRLGKSNVVKLIAQAMLDATKDTGLSTKVGQLIFDINGEYANDSDQDEVSLRSANPDRCEVYALTKRPQTPSKELKLNFYENPSSCKPILGTFLDNDGKRSNYITAFCSVMLNTFDEITQMQDYGDKSHAIRKIQIYWSILYAAGFMADENVLRSIQALHSGVIKPLDPHFNKDVMKLLYPDGNPPFCNSLDDMCAIYKKAAEYINENGDLTTGTDNKSYFTVDEKALLGFLVPKSGSGPIILSGYRTYHSPNAKDFVKDILHLLDDGKTVILDLGNARDEIRKYFSDLLSANVFSHQEDKFVNNLLGDTFIELYFEEAHNLFPPVTDDNQDVYSRFAKEGAKFHIGMVYSTQSPSTISKELLVQTENFFVGHMSSSDETKALVRTQIAFAGIEQDILRSKTKGFMRMLTMSNRFVIPMQANRYQPQRGEAKSTDSNADNSDDGKEWSFTDM